MIKIEKSKFSFAIVLVCLLVLVSGSTAMANLLQNHRAAVTTGYGYGYFANNTRAELDYGYNTYSGVNPIADTHGGCPNGSLVKTATSSTVWWIQDGRKHAVISSVVFMSWGFNWADIVTVTQGQLDRTPLSASPLKARPGTLLKMFHDPTIYIVGWEGEGVEAVHPIISMGLFSSLGLQMADIFEISVYEMGNYLDGAPITSGALLADGTLVKGSGPAVYLWEGDEAGRAINNYTLEPFASTTSFNSWSFKWSNVMTISDVELGDYLLNNTVVGRSLLAKPGTLIKGSAATVYVTDFLARPTKSGPAIASPWVGNRNWAVRPISSMAAFNGKGYRLSNLYTVPDAEVGLYWLDSSSIN
ncbi:MAG: hypothetical protein WC891_01120 [Actinomycetota bacterium]